MNISTHLTAMAAAQPDAIAIKIPRGRTRVGTADARTDADQIDYLALTFAELHAEVTAWNDHLVARGVRPGDRVLVMVRQGLPLIASVFALFRLGAVPVIIDPGMGLKSFLRCVAHSRPRALLGIPVARFLSRVCWRAFRTVEVRVAASSSPFSRIKNAPAGSAFSLQPSAFPQKLAAILFTSGSTGAPKGVCYEHDMFEAQVRSIRATYGIEPGERDLSMLPIFALFAPALGMTTIVPEIDPSRPAMLDPAKIVQTIQQEKITNSFGSPTLWNKIADYCIQNNITLPSLRRVLCAGAPVPAALWEKARKILPNGKLHSPYGATECLPVSTISGDEVEKNAHKSTLAQGGAASLPPDEAKPRPLESIKSEARYRASGGRDAAPPCAGACVGGATPEIQIKIIALTDAPIATLADARELPRGKIGEIIVTGPAVTREYDALPEATAAAKIAEKTNTDASPVPPDPHGLAARATQTHGQDARATQPATIWHRMGDTGYLDADGRLWFCGRKAERVESATGTLFTEPCEQVFRPHPQVTRCALVGLGPRGSQIPAIVIQPANKNLDRTALTAELRALALAQPHTAVIERFYFHPNFPVDVRHNAKIHRLTLAKWAEGQKAERLKS